MSLNVEASRLKRKAVFGPCGYLYKYELPIVPVEINVTSDQHGDRVVSSRYDVPVSGEVVQNANGGGFVGSPKQ